MDDKEEKRLKAIERAKLHYSKNTEAKKEYAKNYYKNNKSRHSELVIKYNLENKEELTEYRKRYYIENREKKLKYAKEYRQNNLELKRQKDKEYALKHPEKLRANKAKRKKAVRKATPNWLTKEQLNEIELFYALAIKLETQTGIEHQVDHIVPIQGKEVCGLHVPWNLQVLTFKENREKSNKLLEQTLNLDYTKQDD